MPDWTTEYDGITIPPGSSGRHHHRLMYALIAVVVILAGFLLGAAATHQNTIPGASRPSANQLDHPVTPPAYNLAVGQSVIITADVLDYWDVTVNSVRQYTPGQYDTAPPVGSHWVDVNVTYAARSGNASVDAMDWKLKIENGRAVVPTTIGVTKTELQAATIPAPTKKTGDVYLAVPEGAPVVAVIYSAGQTEQASWDISG